MGRRPRGLDFGNLKIDFRSPRPATCDICEGKIRKEIVSVRPIPKSKGNTDRTVFDTALMCDCMVYGRPTMAEYKTGGLVADAWSTKGD